jgi:hypothetical protein
MGGTRRDSLNFMRKGMRMNLTSAIYKRVANYSGGDSIGERCRKKRMKYLLDMIEAEAARPGPVRILDLGGERNYWNILPAGFLQQHRARVTLVNLPGHNLPVSDEIFEDVQADACDLSMFDSMSYAIVHSNSVIEHVGDWSRMEAFAAEVRRLAPKYFVQTPNFWFPMEPHFMTPFYHWLPEPVRAAIIRNHPLGGWPKARSIGESVAYVQSARLLDRKMFGYLFPDGDVVTERLYGLPKSLIALKGR